MDFKDIMKLVITPDNILEESLKRAEEEENNPSSNTNDTTVEHTGKVSLTQTPTPVINNSQISRFFKTNISNIKNNDFNENQKVQNKNSIKEIEKLKNQPETIKKTIPIPSFNPINIKKIDQKIIAQPIIKKNLKSSQVPIVPKQEAPKKSEVVVEEKNQSKQDLLNDILDDME